MNVVGVLLLAAGILLALSLLAMAVLWLLALVTWGALARRPAKDVARIEARLLAKGEIRREWIDAPWVRTGLASPEGYALSARGLPGTNGRLAILHHGVTWNWMGALKYAAFLHEAGYSVALFDSRGHGESGGKGPSFGVHEAGDLGIVASWARAAFPSEAGTLLFGVSLGAASVLQYASRDPSVAAVIADCPFSSAAEILDHRLLRNGIPAFLRPPIERRVDRLCRLFDRFSIFEASPAKAALEVEVPVLLVHGLDDDYVPFAMSESMAAGRRRALPEAVTELFLVPRASHARSHRVGPESYERAVLDFAERAFASSPARPPAPPPALPPAPPQVPPE